MDPLLRNQGSEFSPDCTAKGAAVEGRRGSSLRSEEKKMKKLNVKILLPEVIYQWGVFVLLFYRKFRYGCAFRIIELTQGLRAIVEQEDYERIAKNKWHAAKHQRSYYAQTGTGSAKTGKRRNHLVMMHRYVMGVEDERYVDHRNHNGLDNRRFNLRIATWQENCWNKRKKTTGSSSQYKGVMWDKRRSKWHAMIGHNGKKIFIGYFDDEEAAARAYDAKAKELYGEYAALNFPENQNDPLGDWSFKICYGKYTG